MAAISAGLVKELRDKTGAGMMDCKKALTETDGNVEEAVDWLRTKGLAAAAKKAGRVASEGLVGVVADGTTGAVIEVNSETDFVSRNEDFQKLVSTLTTIALENEGDLAAINGTDYPGTGRSVEDEITQQIATIGENLSIRRADKVSVGSGLVASYVHSALAEGLGKIGVLLALESDGNAEKLAELGKQLAMHIAAARPEWVAKEDVSEEDQERERKVLREQAADSGKPPEIIEKMVDGRMRKYYEEVCLMEQTFVIDNETKISKVLKNAAGDIGGEVKVAGFIRYGLGEGIEKEESDFAAEVAATAGT
ncbi:MAG: elongation factor Ts [Rhodospirillaceae bacterium]|nr:elongation factor Ts [Rhodospirillaceae bacterium]MBL25433.1 elongation factor Ts [Rhodospirillaceae bacterium]HAA92039.1 elongation factor Ts [Rhodospirillaceae bacterium]